MKTKNWINEGGKERRRWKCKRKRWTQERRGGKGNTEKWVSEGVEKRRGVMQKVEVRVREREKWDSYASQGNRRWERRGGRYEEGEKEETSKEGERERQEKGRKRRV